MHEKMAQLVKRSYPKVNFLTLDIRNVGLENDITCDTVQFELPSRVDIESDIVVKVDLYTHKQFVRRQTHVFRFFGVAEGIIVDSVGYRGQAVSHENLKKGPIDFNQITAHTISDLNTKRQWQYRNYINKGDVLESWMVEPIPDIQKGEVVKAVVTKKNIMLTLEGRVLENGNIGQDIRVELNNKVVIGKLNDEKTIYINNI